ncbi:MAG: hypothetical protein DIU68_018185 [Chloroflexota bacterium]|nr:MAG: hypothetical protein DIU68_18270 [Chloroflexota bacterium]
MLEVKRGVSCTRPTALDGILAEMLATGCGFSVHKAGVDQPLAGGGPEPVRWSGKWFDRSRNFDLAGGRFICRSRGRYLFQARARFTGEPGMLLLYRNGVEACDALEGVADNGAVLLVAGLLLHPGDAVALYAAGNGALSGHPRDTWFAGRRLL